MSSAFGQMVIDLYMFAVNLWGSVAVWLCFHNCLFLVEQHNCDLQTAIFNSRACFAWQVLVLLLHEHQRQLKIKSDQEAKRSQFRQNRRIINILREGNAIIKQPKSPEMRVKLEKMRLLFEPAFWKKRTQSFEPRLPHSAKRRTHLSSFSCRKHANANDGRFAPSTCNIYYHYGIFFFT